MHSACRLLCKPKGEPQALSRLETLVEPHSLYAYVDREGIKPRQPPDLGAPNLVRTLLALVERADA